jgi:hypothetical protein
LSMFSRQLSVAGCQCFVIIVDDDTLEIEAQ